MPFLSTLKSLLYKADLFNSNSLLRVRGEPEHTTLIGGILSITLMIVLATAFSNKIIDTLDKVIISSTTTTKNADDPTPFSFNTLGNGTFMMGVEILNYNLNAPTRAFDIVLRDTIYQYGSIQNTSIEYKLQACTRQHWNGYPQIQNKYNNLGISNWMCLPKNRAFEIKGKYASAQSKTLDIIARKCTVNHIDTRPCASQAEVDQLFNDNDGNLFFSVYFLNPLINPDSQEYLAYYLEDSYYISFSQTGGEESRLLVQDYQIVTDQSILPNSNLLTETGGVIMDSPLKTSFFTINHTYATFYFFKSPISLSYTRQFQKIDEVFSYIGGLFGTIIIAFFLISIYNTYKYEISLSGYMYRTETKEKLEKSYHFAYYLGQMVYTVLRLFNCRPRWQRLSYYYETREEILKQLDILLLLKRINFLQKSLSLLFSEHQIIGLHLATQFTMSQAVVLRKKYMLKSRLKAEIESQRRKDSSEKSMNIDCNKQQIIVSGRMDGNENKQRQRVEIEDQFNSDHYTSQSSQEEEEDLSILGSVVKLRSQKDDNAISARIWRCIDSRLKVLIESTCNKRTDLQCQEQLPVQQFYHEGGNKNSRLFFDQMDQPAGDSMQQVSQHKMEQARVLFKKLNIAHADQQFNSDLNQ